MKKKATFVAQGVIAIYNMFSCQEVLPGCGDKLGRSLKGSYEVRKAG